MLHFTNKITIHICARTQAQQNRWVSVFQRLAGCFNQAETLGGWAGPKVTETERDVTITVWFSPDYLKPVRRLLKYAQWYQQEAQQEAVSIETVIAGKWQAFVIFAGEWRQAAEVLAQDIYQALPQ